MVKEVISVHNFDWPGSSNYDWSFNEKLTEDGKLFLLAMNFPKVDISGIKV